MIHYYVVTHIMQERGQNIRRYGPEIFAKDEESLMWLLDWAHIPCVDWECVVDELPGVKNDTCLN